MVDASGKSWLDYPYAEDGLDIWNGFSKYFTSYLNLYYKSDADVLNDPELQAWWTEVKVGGRAGGWLTGGCGDERGDMCVASHPTRTPSAYCGCIPAAAQVLLSPRRHAPALPAPA